MSKTSYISGKKKLGIEDIIAVRLPSSTAVTIVANYHQWALHQRHL